MAISFPNSSFSVTKIIFDLFKVINNMVFYHLSGGKLAGYNGFRLEGYLTEFFSLTVTSQSEVSVPQDSDYIHEKNNSGPPVTGTEFRLVS